MIRLNNTGGGTPLYQLKITLRGYKPFIWRRVILPADMKLDRLHCVIQTAMGWKDSHLHQFVAGNECFGQTDCGCDAGDPEMQDERRYTVTDLAPAARAKFIYEYDLGDSWEHEILLEKILPPQADFKHPSCLGGANACPPEDCGGSYGYAGFVEAMADPKHEEHEQMKEWIGGAWDAAYFDLDKVNAGLKKIKA